MVWLEGDQFVVVKGSSLQRGKEGDRIQQREGQAHVVLALGLLGHGEVDGLPHTQRRLHLHVRNGAFSTTVKCLFFAKQKKRTHALLRYTSTSDTSTRRSSEYRPLRGSPSSRTPCPSAGRACRAPPPAPNPPPHGSANSTLHEPAAADPHSPPHTPSANSCARMPYLARGAHPWCSTTHTPSSLPPNPLVSAHSLHAHNTTPHTTPAIATTALASHGGGTLRQAASRSARMPSDQWRARLPRIPAKGGREKRRSRKRRSHHSAARSCPQRGSWTRDDGNREGAQSRSMMLMWKQHRHIR